MRYPASDPLLTCLEVVWIDAKGSGRKKKQRHILRGVQTVKQSLRQLQIPEDIDLRHFSISDQRHREEKQ